MFDEPIMYASPPDLTKFENLEKWYQFVNTSEKHYDLKQCLIYDFHAGGGGGGGRQCVLVNNFQGDSILLYTLLHMIKWQPT